MINGLDPSQTKGLDSHLPYGIDRKYLWRIAAQAWLNYTFYHHSFENHKHLILRLEFRIAARKNACGLPQSQ